MPNRPLNVNIHLGRPCNHSIGHSEPLSHNSSTKQRVDFKQGLPYILVETFCTHMLVWIGMPSSWLLPFPHVTELTNPFGTYDALRGQFFVQYDPIYLDGDLELNMLIYVILIFQWRTKHLKPHKEIILIFYAVPIHFFF